jgi:hypothetical protein
MSGYPNRVKLGKAHSEHMTSAAVNDVSKNGASASRFCRPLVFWSIGHASDTTGFNPEFSIFLPIEGVPFPHLRNRHADGPALSAHRQFGPASHNSPWHAFGQGRNSFVWPAIW